MGTQHDFLQEIRTAYEVDEQFKTSISARVLLRTLPIMSMFRPNVPDQVLLVYLRSILNLYLDDVDEPWENHSVYAWDYNIEKSEAWFHFSTRETEATVTYSSDAIFYELSWEGEEASSGDVFFAISKPDNVLPGHYLDLGCLQKDVETAKSKLDKKSILSTPLWPAPDRKHNASLSSLLSYFDERSAVWGFWRSMVQALVEGSDYNAALNKRIVQIQEPTWDAGPEAVAAEIERIRSLFELEQEVARLKEQLTAVEHTPAAAQIGDNGGPPLEDAAARALQTDLALIWNQVEELEEEIAKPSPSPSLLKKIAQALWDISLRMAAYCGSVADGMIREGSKELAKAGAKWTAGATAVTVTAQTEGVQSVAKAIWAFVKALQ